MNNAAPLEFIELVVEIQIQEQRHNEQVRENNGRQRTASKHERIGIHHDRNDRSKNGVARIGQQGFSPLGAGDVDHEQEKERRGPEEGADLEVMGIGVVFFHEIRE